MILGISSVLSRHSTLNTTSQSVSLNISESVYTTNKPSKGNTKSSDKGSKDTTIHSEASSKVPKAQPTGSKLTKPTKMDNN